MVDLKVVQEKKIGENYVLVKHSCYMWTSFSSFVNILFRLILAKNMRSITVWKILFFVFLTWKLKEGGHFAHPTALNKYRYIHLGPLCEQNVPLLWVFFLSFF